MVAAGRRAALLRTNRDGQGLRVLGRPAYPGEEKGTISMARGKGDESQAAAMRLVGIALERYTFLTSQTGEPFAIPNGGPQVARLLRGGKHSLRAELSYAYVLEHQAVPSQQALADAMLTLEGRAASQPVVPLHVRVASVNSAQLHRSGRRDRTGDPDQRRHVEDAVSHRPESTSAGPS
jgi:hypothetical protein